MAIPARQIGWSQKSNLLWQISKQLEYLTGVLYKGTTTTTSSTSSTTTTTTTTAPTYTIGEAALGGTIAYILQPGDPGYDAGTQHGLVATVNDLIGGTGTYWGCTGVLISGTFSTAIGSGSQNTINIVNECFNPSFAAKLCSDLVEGGYSDWYLPSKDELYQLYVNRVAIGNFSIANYWSSSQFDLNTADSYQFDVIPLTAHEYKALNFNVRAIRSF